MKIAIFCTKQLVTTNKCEKIRTLVQFNEDDEKPHCTCTKVVLELNTPPRYEDKNGA